MGLFSKIFGGVTKLVGGLFDAVFGIALPSAPRIPVAPPPQKPLSPITNRATTEGIIRRPKRARASLASGPSRSLLNEETVPLGTTK